MPVCRHRRLLFIHIPKTGGTSIELALGMHGQWNIESQEKLFGQIVSDSILDHNPSSNFLQHLTFREVCSLFPEVADWFSFTVVRNPWDRLVSSFENLDTDLCNAASHRGIDLASLEFADFVQAVIELDHPHVRQQVDFIRSHGDRSIKRILRFEQLDSDFRRLAGELRLDLPLPHANRSQRRPYVEYYSERSRELVARSYAQDVLSFGYGF